MNFKKMMSGALAAVMALSLSATAFATSNKVTDLTEGAQLDLTSVTKGAVIEVLVPSSAMIALNPYQMNVKLEDGKLVDDTAAGAQVISPVYKIENRSSLQIDVDVAVTGTLNGEGMEFAAAKPATGDTKKSVFVQMQYGPGTTSATTVTGTKKLTLAAEEVKGEKQTMAAYDKDSTTATSNYLFTFSGNLNAKSTTAWTADDTIGATIAFTFSIKV